MSYADAAVKQNERLVKAIDSDPEISESTKKLILEYSDFMRAKGLTDRTLQKNLYCISIFLKLAGRKDLPKVTKQDMMHAMAALERTEYSEKTKQNVKVSIKSMYKHLLGEDEFYPEQVRWISTTLKESKRMLPEDILREDEIRRMIESSNDTRDKAMIALLYDSGIRVGELLNMRVKDVDLGTEPMHITVTGKTGMRRIPLMISAPYLGVYMNLLKTRKATDRLWGARGSLINTGRAIDRAGVAMVLKRTARAAGITKRVNPHSFRHARATHYANKLTEQQLKMFFGWTGGSKMAATYVHLSGRDLDNAILEANGMQARTKASEPKLKIVECPRCRYQNGPDMIHCGRCGATLEISLALKEQELAKHVSEQAEKELRLKKGEESEARDVAADVKGRRRPRRKED